MGKQDWRRIEGRQNDDSLMHKRRSLKVPAPLSPRTEKEILSDWEATPNVPKVTIICHTYNHANYVRDTVNGFLAQKTLFPFEIVIHDDASTDGTAEIVQQYALQYPNLVKVIAQKNNQYSQGRRPPRFTFPMARGEFIAFCEGDDYWIDLHKLSKQVKLLDEHSDFDLCMHPAYRHSVRYNNTRVMCAHRNEVCALSVSCALERLSQFSPTASLMFRRRAALAMPDWFFYDPTLLIGDFFMETIMGRSGVIYTPDVMSVYRSEVEGSHSARTRTWRSEDVVRRFENEFKLVKKLLEYEEISSDSVEKRLQLRRGAYLRELVATNDYFRFKDAMRFPFVISNQWENAALRAATQYRALFRLLYEYTRFHRKSALSQRLRLIIFRQK